MGRRRGIILYPQSSIFYPQLALRNQLARDLHGRPPVLVNCIFEMILRFIIGLKVHNIFGRVDTKLLEPLGIHVKPARRLPHRLAKDFLPFSAQEPIDKNFRRVWMGRIFKNRYSSTAVTRVGSLLGERQRLDRQPGFDEGLEGVIRNADRQREFSFGKRVGDLSWFVLIKRSC